MLYGRLCEQIGFAKKREREAQLQTNAIAPALGHCMTAELAPQVPTVLRTAE